MRTARQLVTRFLCAPIWGYRAGGTRSIPSSLCQPKTPQQRQNPMGSLGFMGTRGFSHPNVGMAQPGSSNTICPGKGKNPVQL